MITGAELLRAVARAIDENPGHYRQNTWLDHEPEDEDQQVDQVIGNAEHLFNDLKNGQCGTTACLAGWAVALSYDKDNPPPEFTHREDYVNLDSVINPVARRMFGLEGDRDSDILFDPDWEPREDLTVGDALRGMAGSMQDGPLTADIILRYSCSRIREYHLED